MDENSVEIDQTDAVLTEDVPMEDSSGPQEAYRSTDSPLHTDKRTYKGGHKRKDDAPVGLSAPPIPIPVPRPKFRVYKTDSAAKDQRPISFLNWWNGLPGWAKDQTVAYIYREHPVLLEPMIDDDGKKLNFKYIDKIIGTEPMQDELDFLHRYGCGSYKLIFNEAEPRKGSDKTKTLCEVYITNVGGGDYKSNPPTDPRISDIEQLDLDNPANKSYISFLRGQGKLPEQMDGKIKEHEMATVETMKEVTTQQGALVKEIIGMARERGQTSENASKAQAEVMADTIKTSNEMTREAAKQSIGMVKDAFDQAKAMLPTATTPQSTENPMAMALEIVKLIREEKTPDQGNDARYDALQAQLAQLQQSQIDRLTKQVETLLEAKVTGPAASTSPFSAMNEGLDSLEKFSTVMERLKGGKEEGEDVVADTIADAAPKWMRPILPVLPGLAQGLLSWLQTRNQQPQVAYYQTADGRILPITQPQVIQPQQMIQAPASAPRQFGPQPVPSPTPNPTQSPDPIYTLLSSITLPFLNYLEANGTGTDFADWFIGGYGEQVYDDVVQLGPDTLFTAVSTFPPISTHEIYAKTPVEQVQALINDFCDPKWPDEEGIEKGTEAGTGPGPGPGPISA